MKAQKLIKPVEIVAAVAVATVGLVYGLKRFALRKGEFWIADHGEDVVADVP